MNQKAIPVNLTHSNPLIRQSVTSSWHPEMHQRESKPTQSTSINLLATHLLCRILKINHLQNVSMTTTAPKNPRQRINRCKSNDLYEKPLIFLVIF